MHRSLLAAAVVVIAGCRGGDRSSPPGAALDLRATPEVASPGGTVTLRATFSGTGRIDPGPGPVVSGAAYEVGPLAGDTTFTLTVERDGVVATRSLPVPLRYRERVTELPAGELARTRAGNV